MEIIKENIEISKGFPFRLFRTSISRNRTPKLHWHDCLEINYVIDGEGTNIIGNQHFVVLKGDIYIINNEEPHYAFSSTTLELLVIVFEPQFIWHNNGVDYDLLKIFFKRNTNFDHCIRHPDTLMQRIDELINDIESEIVEKKAGYQFIIKSNLVKLLAYFNRYYLDIKQIDYTTKSSSKEYERIKEAVGYINSHYTDKLSLETIAHIAAMNATYFSDYFGKVMKMKISHYILSLRMNHATQLLKTSNEPITKVCMDSGFGNISYFNRKFKEITGVSPSQYRKQ